MNVSDEIFASLLRVVCLLDKLPVNKTSYPRRL